VFIYKITNTINGKVYVGQTVSTLSVRWSQHVHEANKNGDRTLCKAIRKYGKENFTIEQIDSACSIEELNKKEQEYIVKLNSLCFNDGQGYNMTLGGEGNSGRIIGNEEKERRNITLHRKEIICNETGIVYSSLKEAAESIGTTAAFIGNVCKGRKPTVKGFTFKYLNDEISNKIATERRLEKEVYTKQHFTYGRPIVCLTTNEEFCSIKEAARKTGVAEVNMYKHLIRLRKTCKGLIFQYRDKIA